jgi:RNA polymerase sigma factor (TIGR02999 family)
MAARIMRRLLVDHARHQHAAKRGAGQTAVPLEEGLTARQEGGVDVLEVDDALIRLAALDSRQAQVVELRFFVGLTNEEIAHVLNVSVPTVKRDWTMARTWLQDALGA